MDLMGVFGRQTCLPWLSWLLTFNKAIDPTGSAAAGIFLSGAIVRRG